MHITTSEQNDFRLLNMMIDLWNKEDLPNDECALQIQIDERIRKLKNLISQKQKEQIHNELASLVALINQTDKKYTSKLREHIVLYDDKFIMLNFLEAIKK